LDAGEEEPVDEAEPPTADEPSPATNEEEEEEEPNMDDGMRRSLDNSKPIKPKDVTVSFSDVVVNTVGFSPFGTVAWAETAVAATIIHGTADTSVAAVGRAETIIQVVATSPPAGSQRRCRRLLYDSSREPIAFCFPLSATELKRLLLPTFFLGSRRLAGVDLHAFGGGKQRRQVQSVGAALGSSLSTVCGLFGTLLVVLVA
jgi:hypothetical protein